MNKSIALFLCLLLNTNLANAIQTTLLAEPVIAALSQELSGEIAKRNLEYIARHHRMCGSRGFRAAAEHIVAQLHEYGILKDHRRDAEHTEVAQRVERKFGDLELRESV